MSMSPSILLTQNEYGKQAHNGRPYDYLSWEENLFVQEVYIWQFSSTQVVNFNIRGGKHNKLFIQ